MNKHKYKEIASSEIIRLFSQPHWLDAVCGEDSWDAVVLENNGVSVAAMPFYLEVKYGLRFISQPLLTQSLGPWLSPYEGKYHKQLSRQKRLINLLIEELPSFDYFCQNFHYSITNWLPFYWKGFQQVTRYTYVLEDLSDTDFVWSRFRENIRREIRKASKKLVIRTDLGIEKFLDLNLMTFKRQGIRPPYSRKFVNRLDFTCKKQGSRKIFFAEDSDGNVHSAIYIVWDKHSAYYLMGGADPALRSSGATSLLMWEAIQHAATVTQKFDFEGSMIESVERFFRAFGARQVPYFQISKMSKRAKFLMSGRNFVKSSLELARW